MKSMRKLKIVLSILIIICVGCSANLSPLDSASTHYKDSSEFNSLKTLVSHLKKGMTQTDVESLLGKPDYSPIEGQYYYSSTERVFSESQQRDVPKGLVVSYRDKDGMVTSFLQEFWLGPIEE